MLYREAYRRLQNEGKISRLPDSAFLFGSGNLALAMDSDTQELVDDSAALEALLEGDAREIGSANSSGDSQRS